MKTLFYLLAIAMLLFAGCAKDEMFTDEADMNLKKAEMKYVPVKADIYNVSTSDYYGITTAGYLVGNFSHLGKVDPDNSPYTGTISDITEDSYTLYIEGQICGANGDLIYYYFTLNPKFTDTSFVTTVTYDGGTGRFTNCKGSATCIGNIDEATGYAMMKVDGYITSVGSSK